MISILLVDDHELVRTAIRRLLDDVPGVRVIDEADSGEGALASVRRKRPDVVLMDVSMPGIGGLEATRKLNQIYPDLPIIILTIHTDDPFPTRLMKAGASGYLHKGCTVDEIVQAINDVHRGKRYICGSIAQSLALSLLPGNEGSPFDSLSQRELQVMLMMVQGHKVQEVADKLHLSPKTVSTYRYRLFSKLNVTGDAELTRLAIRHGMIEGNV